MREHTHRFKGLDGGLGAVLTAPTARETQLGVYATFPVHNQDHFTGLRIDIDDDVANQGANDTFLQPGIGPPLIP